MNCTKCSKKIRKGKVYGLDSTRWYKYSPPASMKHAENLESMEDYVQYK
jgi:hypothetical protein